MPSYEYRCDSCGRLVNFSYKTYREYDEAERLCPHCGSAGLTRLISRVAIGRPTRNYGAMSSTEMLSVLEGGKPEEMGAMFRQVAESVPEGMDQQYHEVTERLLRGEKPETIEGDLQAGASPGGGDAPSTAADTSLP